MTGLTSAEAGTAPGSHTAITINRQWAAQSSKTCYLVESPV